VNKLNNLNIKSTAGRTKCPAGHVARVFESPELERTNTAEEESTGHHPGTGLPGLI